MFTPSRILPLPGTAVLFASGAALAQGKVDLGKREYDSNCASCHGRTAREKASTPTS